MGHNLSPCTPTTFHIDQGRPGNVVSDATRNNFGARYGLQPLFLNGRHGNLIWTIFLIKITYNHNFGVYTYVFRVKKFNETTYINIGSFPYGEFGKIQDGDC